MHSSGCQDRPVDAVPARSRALRSAPVLPATDARDLQHFFGPAGSPGEHSPFGAMLERQANLYRTSDQQVVPSAAVELVTRELAGSTAASPRFAQVLTGWAYRRVLPDQRAAYEPDGDHDGLIALGRDIERLLRLLPPAVRAVLALLYGDRGCRWQQRPEGRVWALVPEVAAGRRALERDAAARAEKGLPSVDLPPAERLAQLATSTPRPAWYDASLNQAERLTIEAERAWQVARAEAC